MTRTSAIWAVLLLASSACASTLPAGRGESILYRDLERIVGLRSAAGWEVDRLEIEEALSDALLSVCATEAPTRASLLAWVDARLAALGGPVEAAWLKRGRDLGNVAELLTLTRLRGVLVAAMDATAEDCPFWVEARADFPGRQIVDDRWQLELAGGGKGIVGLARFSASDLDLTGGGAGRVSVFRHFGAHWTLGLGLEMGASVDFLRDENGQRAGVLFAYDTVVPLIVRYRLVSSFYELELGLLGHGAENKLGLDPGLHVGVAVGARALRQSWFTPGASFAISYEQTFPDGNDGDPLYLVKLGLRVSIDLDL